jgi:hypothetical protein
MTCRCGKEMKWVEAWDNAQSSPEGKDYAFNLYVCVDCGRVCKDSVWADPGKLWIGLEGVEP